MIEDRLGLGLKRWLEEHPEWKDSDTVENYFQKRIDEYLDTVEVTNAASAKRIADRVAELAKRVRVLISRAERAD